MRLSMLHNLFAALVLTSLVGCQSGMSMPRWDWWRSASTKVPDTSALARSAPQFPKLPSKTASPTSDATVAAAAPATYPTTTPSGAPPIAAVSYPNTAYPTTRSFNSPASHVAPASVGPAYPSTQYPATLANSPAPLAQPVASQSIAPQTTPYAPSTNSATAGPASATVGVGRSSSPYSSGPSRYMAAPPSTPVPFRTADSRSSQQTPADRYGPTNLGPAASSPSITATPPAPYPTTAGPAPTVGLGYANATTATQASGTAYPVTAYPVTAYPVTAPSSLPNGVVPAGGQRTQPGASYRPGGTSDYPRPAAFPPGNDGTAQPWGGTPTTGMNARSPLPNHASLSAPVPEARGINNPYVRPTVLSPVSTPDGTPASYAAPTTAPAVTAPPTTQYNSGSGYR